jgi:beta-lactamase regulating signal transducer with metallopeptidase domain
VSPWLSAAAGLVAGVGVWRVASVLRAHFQLRRVDGGVQFVEHDTPFAFTAPGRGGLIVVSSALDDALEADEMAVVLAHERAHVRHRHDRYLLLVQLIAACLPPLTPLVRQIRFSIERWADEDAVADCGDRRLVAQTLGRVALMGAPMSGALAFGGLGVAARMDALLSPRVVPSRGVGRILVPVLVALTAACALLQIRHLSGMVLALCWG